LKLIFSKFYARRQGIFPSNPHILHIMKKVQKSIIGVSAGLLNGLFGSGGGVVTVPLLERSGLEQRKCHATSVVLIFVLSFVSAGMYALHDKLEFGKALEFVPAGLVGAVIGAILLRRVKNRALKRVFGIIIIVSAIRMLAA
jgi:hypothetical protein